MYLNSCRHWLHCWLMRGLVVGYTLLDWLGGFMRGTYGASIIPVRPGLRCCLEGSHGACVLKLSLPLARLGWRSSAMRSHGICVYKPSFTWLAPLPHEGSHGLFSSPRTTRSFHGQTQFMRNFKLMETGLDPSFHA